MPYLFFHRDLRKWVKQRREKAKTDLPFPSLVSLPLNHSILSAFTPVSHEKPNKRIFGVGVQDDDFLRRRKEEEQRRFQETQLNIHPLMSEESADEEQVLRDVLGKSTPGQRFCLVKIDIIFRPLLKIDLFTLCR